MPLTFLVRPPRAKKRKKPQQKKPSALFAIIWKEIECIFSSSCIFQLD